ncbi:MAG: GGDEF domain-containing protein [Lachnospiraceae bacterium]|nr:GGDEF domain-containing protein [Lachnospiraceae bacterium]
MGDTEKKASAGEGRPEQEKKKKVALSGSQLRYGAATFVLILVLIALSIGFILRMYFVTETRCYDELANETESAIEQLEANFRSDRMLLRIISGMISRATDMDSLEVSNYLSNYDVNSMIMKIGILFPDDQVMQVGGHKSSMKGLLDFEKEAALGEHISPVQPDSSIQNLGVIRNYIPIRTDGETVAMLYSAGSPSNIASAWMPKLYDGKAGAFVVERKSGDVLINTSDISIGNIDEIPFVQTNKDYTKKLAADDIRNGRRGYSVFRSSIGSEMLYMCYLPFDIEEWEMVVFVPESAVFAAVQPIRVGMFVLIGLVVLALMIYSIWTVHEIKLSLAETERRANIDVLTGLQNRNRYEAYLKELDVRKEKLTCLYIDANGLHDLNNSRGHYAGDQMLRFIADTLKIQFGEEHVYRIGGDEFVVFQSGRSEKAMQESLNSFNEALQRNDYHAAVGLCVYGFGMSVDQLIKNAEKEMYEAKRKYYERIGKVMRV